MGISKLVARKANKILRGKEFEIQFGFSMEEMQKMERLFFYFVVNCSATNMRGNA